MPSASFSPRLRGGAASLEMISKCRNPGFGTYDQHLRCHGITALLEGDYAAARSNLEQSIALMEKTRHLPFRDGNISVAKAYLCCALARQKEFTAAKKYYAEAHPYLLATDEAELMRDCERALSGRA